MSSNSDPSRDAVLSEAEALSLCLAVGIFDLGDRPRSRVLTGGVSGAVYQIYSPTKSVVVKQALSTLRVDAEWHMDPARSTIEASCLRYLATLLPPGSTPEVLYTVNKRHIVIMTSAPEGSVVWKDEILAGGSGPEDAKVAGKLLRTIHTRAAGDGVAASRFADRSFFVQGRVDPFHREVARVYPELAEMIEHEIDRMLSVSQTLVLADYTPKNLLNYHGRMVPLDFEMAHWGDPAFDVASCLAHLIAKEHRAEVSESQSGMARSFFEAYLASRALVGSDEFVSHVAAEVGCILLARVDGKSPLAYLDVREREDIRRLGRRILIGGSSCLMEELA